jgi:hypothetical protein
MQVLYAQTDINVKGKVKGNSTLATKSGKSICVVGDLVYQDFDESNTSNNGVPLNSQNALGLVSGKDIVFNPDWAKLRASSGSNSTDQVKGTYGNGSVLCLNANMLMVNPAMANSTNSYSGIEKWITNSTGYGYQLHFTGSHAMNYWEHTNDDNTHGGVGIHYDYDERFANGVKPYGYQSLQTTGGFLILSYGNWTESNSY